MSMQKIVDKKIIVWGRSKLLEFYIEHTPEHSIAYAVDSNKAVWNTEWNSVLFKSPESITSEKKGKFVVVIFAVSTNAISSILKELNAMGLLLGEDVLLYSDIFYDGFSEKVHAALGHDVDVRHYELAKSFSLNSRIPVHTTILGNTLFLELLADVIARGDATHALAEVGAFNGGNAILASQYMTMKEVRPFHVFDSFEGFPELSKNDPVANKVGDYNIETSLEHILDSFSMFPFVHIHKGFVPKTFDELDQKEGYGLVFYDCDLYEPALATFGYFWDRLIPGGYMLIHDYVAEKGGFVGVRKATDEFFNHKNIQVHEFWENTMGLAIKPTD